MAIQKSKTLANGSSGDYWRILDIHIDRQNLKLSGRIALFKDAATSAAGSPPLGAEKIFHFPLVMADFLAAPNAVSFMYGLITADAESLVTMDMNGNVIDPAIAKDPDLAGGIQV